MFKLNKIKSVEIYEDNDTMYDLSVAEDKSYNANGHIVHNSEICEHLDGNIRRQWGSFAPPNHWNCRSILIPVTIIDEWDGKNFQPKKEPQKGFGQS
jgi:hypothetical protein